MKSIIKKFIPKKVLSWYHMMWPFLGALIYRYPSKKLKVIGITGTNGKTTTTHLASYLLEQSGIEVASVSSLRFKIGKKEWDNKLKMTMPGRMKLQKFMRQAVNAGCTHLVMEVTSEGVKQNRHRFIKFDTAVFTNLTKEHIENHGNFENYKKAKGRFFSIQHRLSIVNFDDNHAEYFLGFSAKEKIGYTTKDALIADNALIKIISAENIKHSSTGISFDIEGSKFSIPMLGSFNIDNSLAAIGIGLGHGISIEKAADILNNFEGVPGRMEVIIDKPYTVIADYAHTPDALIKVYKTIENINTREGGGKMICVLGSAGGGRDKWKRPEIGKIASEYCDQIILTDEDPYTEDPKQILQDIESGILNFGSKIPKILDRRDAIHKGLELAKKDDVVIVTGKGAEPLMVTASGSIPWDDREVIKEEYTKLYK
ncbi:MAG: UDP-N-acetylmuramoyl-L-alanyl-D-glutamate--2,6-diaminopimelate ligase [Candidatus Spechtbacterales bacterium]|nr:UDP-N-acetylmuramoyl-L-alanyl-D-glutamate--2,6-diaminopimelate ligase [Candidatus Spechtbacterales bacterium]